MKVGLEARQHEAGECFKTRPKWCGDPRCMKAYISQLAARRNIPAKGLFLVVQDYQQKMKIANGCGDFTEGDRLENELVIMLAW